MMRRTLALAGAFVVFNSTGCALLELVTLPLKILFSLLGSLGSAVGIADVVPVDGPAPVVRAAGEETWVVEGLRPEVACSIVCSAPGFHPRTYAWPEDFAGRGGEVAVTLDRDR